MPPPSELPSMVDEPSHAEPSFAMPDRSSLLPDRSSLMPDSGALMPDQSSLLPEDSFQAPEAPAPLQPEVESEEEDNDPIFDEPAELEPSLDGVNTYIFEMLLKLTQLICCYQPNYFDKHVRGKAKYRRESVANELYSQYYQK